MSQGKIQVNDYLRYNYFQIGESVYALFFDRISKMATLIKLSDQKITKIEFRLFQNSRFLGKCNFSKLKNQYILKKFSIKLNKMANKVDLAHLQAIADAMAGGTNQAVR